MKKLLYLIGIFSIEMTSALNAQNNFFPTGKHVAYTNSLNTGDQAAPDRKKFKDVSGLILTRFKTNFPGVTDDAWTKTDDGFMVTFTLKDIQNRAYLNKQGHSKSIVRYYTENELPATVRRLVITNNYGFQITLVREVSCNNSIAYLVTIEDMSSWKVIQVLNEEMYVWEDHLKS